MKNKYEDKILKALSEIDKICDQTDAINLDSNAVKAVFEKLTSLSVKPSAVEDKDHSIKTGNQILKVAYQGTEGAYSFLAIQKYFSDISESVVPVGYTTISDAFHAVKSGDADFAMLPIENTIAGSINQTYDMLSHTSLTIVGEEIWPVKHCLLAIEDTPLSRIRRIYSHPVALEQCSSFLSSLANCTIESFIDTAGAAKRVKNAQDITHAAVASSEAAELYGLNIIKEDIANEKENFTRFVLIGREPLEYPDNIKFKTSLLLVTNHEEGALVDCLTRLAEHNINMTKLESRPITGAPWEYMFYIDIEGSEKDSNISKALEFVRQKALRLRIMGSYPYAERDNKDAVEKEVIEIFDDYSKDTEKKKRETACVRKDYPFKLASLAARKEKSVFKIKDVMIGEGFKIIAGPCAVESKDQIMQSAAMVKDNGGHILRGGVFKPRTSPYSFQGLGLEGLEYLAEAGSKYSLPVVTEVVTPEDVEPVSKLADILQIGARNMQNFALLKETGLAGKPVFLKRGMMASIEEWLLAAEYILAQGNNQVILCERGIRSFDKATRNTLDISAVPVCRSMTHLPVFIDPSHACGVREWIPDLAAAAAAVHADGIMVEIHPDPASALCDKEQALDSADFKEMLASLKKYT
ncbi:MAG: 3-deoxy-7-phosphoheptulonate synthase [Planctomycetota bacterium]|jgi:chorismate mutase/prephenate dehydratase